MPERFRTGRSIGRTVYQVEEDGSERCVGMLDTPELARLFVDAANARRADQEGRRGYLLTDRELERWGRTAFEIGVECGRHESTVEAREAGRLAGRQEAAQAIHAEADAMKARSMALMYVDVLRRAARIAEGDTDA